MTRAIARVLLAGVKRQRNPRDYMHKRKEKDANVCRQGSRFSRSSHNDGCNDTEGYASLYPRLRATRFARAFDLLGRAAGCLTQIITNRAQINTTLWKSAPKSAPKSVIKTTDEYQHRPITGCDWC